MKPELKDLIRRRYFQGPEQPIFEHFLKPELTDLSEGKSVIGMTVGPEHLNAAGMIHGGVLASLADLAMGVACITYEKQVVTTDLNIAFIGNVPAGHVVHAVGTVLHNGKTLIRATCGIFDENDRLLMSAQATYFVMGILPIAAERTNPSGL